MMQRSASIMCMLALALTACTTVGPDYQAPAISTPAEWQAPVPHGGRQAALESWWEQFDDPVLMTLLNATATDNPDLDLAWASIEKARANLSTSRAELFPSLDGNASLARARQQQAVGLEQLNTRAAGFDAAWELDLFGKVRRNTEVAQARLQAKVGDWHEARVSLAAEVADNYVQYRGCQLLLDAREQDLKSMEKTAAITAVSVKNGFTSPADGSLARASLASTQSDLLAQQLECELYIKSLVALTGLAEPGLLSLLAQHDHRLPLPRALQIDALPANVLRQRPDLAALERELAAASAAIGAAQAELYPSLSLSGAVTITSSSLASSATTWSFGPALDLPLLDGGRRRAGVAAAKADYQSALAKWHQGVRSAVKESEQSLLNLNAAAQRTEHAAQASNEYRAYFEAMHRHWQTGSESLLDLESARRSALNAQIDHLSLQRQQVQYWIALYKAVGGGWSGAIDQTPQPSP